jgi:predicted DCC family thiol-disulfide oxidoreductase YuxK
MNCFSGYASDRTFLFQLSAKTFFPQIETMHCENAHTMTIVFYDRDCGFCRYLMAKLLRWDARNQLEPFAIQDADEASPLAPMSESERMASWHVALADGSVVSAGAALPIVLDLLGRFKLAARAFRRYPQLTERAYRWVVVHRSTLGKFTRRWASVRDKPYPPVITDGDGDASTCSVP